MIWIRIPRVTGTKPRKIASSQKIPRGSSDFQNCSDASYQSMDCKSSLIVWYGTTNCIQMIVIDLEDGVEVFTQDGNLFNGVFKREITDHPSMNQIIMVR